MPTQGSTVVLKAEVGLDLNEVLLDLAKRQSKWMNSAIKELFVDYHNHNWEKYGPNSPWPGTQKGKPKLVVEVRGKTGYKVSAHGGIYSALIGHKNIRDFGLTAVERQVTLSKLSTTWQNFVCGPKGGTPRPISRKGKTSLPYFGKVAIFPHMQTDVIFEGDRIHIDVRISGKQFKIPLTYSTRASYLDYIEPLRKQMIKGHRSIVELHPVGKNWFVHISITREIPDIKVDKPNRIMGIDLGIKNLTTAVIINGKNGMPEKIERVKGCHLRHDLEKIEHHMRELRSNGDRGSYSHRRAARRLKGKHLRIQKEAARVAIKHAVDLAVENEVEGIAIEDLKKLHPKKNTKGKRFNRRVGVWLRGQTADMIKNKAAQYGIKTVAVYPHGTSRTCPVCGNISKQARSFSRSKYTCEKCGYIGHDDVTGGNNIARRGWNYWHSDKFHSNGAIGAPVKDHTGSPSMEEDRTPQGEIPKQIGRGNPISTSVNRKDPGPMVSTQKPIQDSGRSDPTSTSKQSQRIEQLGGEPPRGNLSRDTGSSRAGRNDEGRAEYPSTSRKFEAESI